MVFDVPALIRELREDAEGLDMFPSGPNHMRDGGITEAGQYLLQSYARTMRIAADWIERARFPDQKSGENG